MAQLLQLFIIIPLIGFLLSLAAPRKRERIISGIAISALSLHGLGVLAFSSYWLLKGYPLLDIKHVTLFQARDFEIFIDFFFDKTTAVFALVGALITFLVAVFSRYYLHREEGFKRFFNTLLFFYLGYNLIIFSGNFETLFIGWEILGISSFLLIAFYRDRFLPVKNGLKTISIYRFSDICLFLTMWLSHHFWHENITFIKLNDMNLVQEQLRQHGSLAIAISIMILVAAAAKSAQLPFSSWLPRAMEGPTSSSAIFYGSLAAHIGVFLLLRTFPFWENIVIVKALVILIGLSTALIASSIAKVQSTVKTQIAYSSIAQIGIIFIEAALGFHLLALIHFAGNAFLRTYQLLVSPSVLSYLTHDQFFNFTPRAHKDGNTIFNKIRNSFYMLAVKEWNLDHLLYRFLWAPFKRAGKMLDFISGKTAYAFLIAAFAGGIFCFLLQESIPQALYRSLPIAFALLAALLVLKSFSERGDARRAWLLLASSQFFTGLAISLNAHVGFNQLAIYLSGTIVSAVAGYWCLTTLKSSEGNIDLDGYHGHAYEQPTLSFLFLLSCLGLLGFPITPSFIGIDILFSHIRQDQLVLIILASLSFVFIEISALRIYGRIFMGQHKKPYHAIAFRSS